MYLGNLDSFIMCIVSCPMNVFLLLLKDLALRASSVTSNVKAAPLVRRRCMVRRHEASIPRCHGGGWAS